MGGVQATASATMQRSAHTIVNGGSGYVVGDTITLTGGTFSTAITFTVATVSAGAVLTLTAASSGTYSVLPTGTLATTTTGAGTGLTLTIDSWGVRSVNITNAGSGYIDQPTVTFSSGAAVAYTTVGTATSIKSLGSLATVSVPSGDVLRIYDYAGQAGIGVRGHIVSGSLPVIFSTPSNGSQTSVGLQITSFGTGSVSFATNASITSQGAFNQVAQMIVAHTASATNYLQATGAATSGTPTLSAQGSSDTNVNLGLTSKNSGVILINTNLGITSLSLTTASTTANQVLTSFDATVYRTIKLTIQATNATNYHSTELLLVHNGSIVNHTEYGTVIAGSACASYSTDYSSSTVRLLVTPVAATTTTYKIAAYLTRI